MASLTSEEYKKKLVERFDLNPNASSRDWEDSEHEILALLLEQTREKILSEVGSLEGKVKRNTNCIEDHDEVLEEHDNFIERFKSRQEAIKGEEKKWYKGRELQLMGLGILSAFIGNIIALLIGIGVL